MSTYLDTAIRAAKVAGKIHLTNLQKKEEVTPKQLRDIVTKTDIEAEERIIEIIKGSFPEHNIYTEESKQPRTSSNFLWVIDPLDGTVNFAAKIPLFNVSISLLENKVTTVAVVYSAQIGELFAAEKGKGAYFNGQQINVSKKSGLSDCIISFGLAPHFSNEEIEKTANIIAGVAREARGARIFMSQGIDMCWIACGRIDGNVGIKADHYSAIPGKLILEEAGGKVTDWHGIEFTKDSPNIVSSNGNIHQYLLNFLE